MLTVKQTLNVKIFSRLNLFRPVFKIGIKTLI